MTISSIYRDFLTEDIIKQSLKEGKVLTNNEIQSLLADLTISNPTLSEPFTQRSIYLTSESEKLSAKKINSILLALKNDLSVAYAALTNQASSSTSTYNLISNEFKAIEKRIKHLEERVNSILLVAKNVDNYIDYLSDTFINKDKVDIVNTDVFVDNKTGLVTLEANTLSRIPLNLTESDLQFNVMSRDQLQAITLAPGTNILNALNDEENIWLQRVQMLRGVSSVTAALIVRTLNSASEVSKIVFTPATSDEGSIVSVIVQYSNDGLNWLNVDGTGTARLVGAVSLLFSPVTANYWRFTFNKAGYDEFKGDSYVYEFGAKSIQFYGVEYKTRNNKLTGTLYTKVLTSDLNTSFDTVSLKVCESIPAGTSIDYSLAGLTDQEIEDYEDGSLTIDDLNFLNITPIEREEVLQPKVINFASIDGLDGLLSSKEKDHLIDFRYKKTDNVLLDYVVPGTVVKSAVQVWRNVGDNTSGDGDNLPVKVNKIDSGWHFDGTYYSCMFFVNEESGKVIDFGQKTVIIDNVSTIGQVTLSKGVHKIKTHKDNWRSIEPLEITTLDNIDILYPYNHKYLIEGISDFLYDVDMTSELLGKTLKEIVDPDSKYSGVLRYWEKSLEEVSIFDFSQNIDSDNFNVFAFTKDTDGNERIVIKDSLEPGLLEEEKLAIITRSVSGDLHRGIILKAEFTSDNSKVTPVLDEYIIRLGI